MGLVPEFGLSAQQEFFKVQMTHPNKIETVYVVLKDVQEIIRQESPRGKSAIKYAFHAKNNERHVPVVEEGEKSLLPVIGS